MRRVAAVVIAVAVLVLLLFALLRDGRHPSVGAIDQATPTLFDTTLRSLRGKPVVVNFWATWCGPCKSEMPRIVAAANEYAGRVHFLGVDVEDDPEAAASFAERYEMPFRSLADPDGEIRRDMNLVGLPVTLFYSADGDLSFSHSGEIFAKELETKIEDVLALREPPED